MSEERRYHRLGQPGGPGASVTALTIEMRRDGAGIPAELFDAGTDSTEIELLRTVAHSLGVLWGRRVWLVGRSSEDPKTMIAALTLPGVCKTHRLSMKPILLATALAMLLSSSRAEQKGGVNTDNFLLECPEQIDARDFIVYSHVTFTGLVQDIKLFKKFTGLKYLIDVKGGKSLKAIVLSPKHQAVLIDAPSLQTEPLRSATLDPKPLPVVRFAGKVTFPDNSSEEKFTLNVNYLGTWCARFLHGGVPYVTLASIDLNKEGTFDSTIADLAHDPGVNNAINKGLIQLSLMEKKTGNHPYYLKQDAESKSTSCDLEIQEDYGFLNLRAVKGD